MDKQLREAIKQLLRDQSTLYGWWDAKDGGYNTEFLNELLALFHTYGNRERIDELATLTPTLVMETECEECVKNEDTISNRIEELNREVES